jgi:phosphoribosylglycinamide formyltransferase 1
LTVAKKRIAVLISGRGSNMVTLAEAARDPDYPAEIVAVISDRADAGGLALAADRGIEAIAVARKDHAGKAAHEAAVLAALDRIAPDIICLAGYMRLLSADFVRRFHGRMINIHPSLLPLFAGLDTHQRALDAGVLIHGCSVHFVTEGMDEGPLIAQAAVPVLPGDTADILQARVLKAEHRLYPMALRMVAEEAVWLEDRRAAFSAEARTLEQPGMLFSCD